MVGNASDPRAKEVSGEMTDDTAHLIKEYRANAARMRAQANSVRGPTEREQFEQIARKLARSSGRLLGPEESGNMTHTGKGFIRLAVWNPDTPSPGT